MTLRSRTQSYPSSSVVQTTWVSQDALMLVATGADGPVAAMGSGSIQDSTSPKPYPDHNLDIHKRRVTYTKCHAPADTIWYGSVRTWKGPLNGHRVGPFGLTGYHPLPGSPPFAYLATAALANANPSRPVVDLPLFLFEMKDFPRMLKGLGDILARKIRPDSVPNGYLAYQFGWAPLFSDLMDLLNLADEIEKRKKYLQRINKKGGARVRRTIMNNPLSAANVSANASKQGANICTGDWVYSGFERGWYTARVKTIGELTQKQIDTKAFRAVLGLNLSAATIWNMLPWSWLIDYFINVGDVLASSRGYIPFSVTKLNVMCHRRLDARFVIKTNGPCKVNVGSYFAEYKGRRPLTAVPRLAFKPFLSGGQMANIGALISARALKGL